VYPGEPVGRHHAGAAEEHLEELGEAGVGDVRRELGVVLGLAGIETILVLQSNDDLIDQRARQARELGPRAALERRQAVGRARVADADLPDAPRGPAGTDVAAALHAGDRTPARNAPAAPPTV